MPQSQQKRFFGKLLKLAGGTALGQVILLAATPVLTRIYTPEDFGTFGLFQAFVSFGTVLAAWRLEQAVMSVRTLGEAARVSLLASKATAISTVILGLILLSLQQTSTLGFEALQAQDTAWAMIAIAAGSLFFTLRAWLIRLDQFNLTAKVTVWQNAGRAFGQICFGLLQLGPTGLVLGDTAGRMLGITRMARTGYIAIRKHLGENPSTTRDLLRRHAAYWKLGLVSTGLNSAAIYLPVPLVTYHYGLESAGFFALAFRLVATPFSLISRSAADAFHHEFNLHWHDSPETAARILTVSARNLARVTVPVGLLGCAVAPAFTALILGAEWETTGWMISLLVPWAVSSSIVSPLSRVVYVMEAQGYKLVYDIATLGFVATVFAASAHLELSAIQALAIYSVGQAILYGLYFLLLYLLTKSGPPADNG